MNKKSVIVIFVVGLTLATIFSMTINRCPSAFITYCFASCAILFVLSGIQISQNAKIGEDESKEIVTMGISFSLKNSLVGFCCSLIAISMVMPFFYNTMAHLNLVPTEYIRVYDEDGLIIPGEQITSWEYGTTYTLKETDDGQIAVAKMDETTGKAVLGPIEGSMGKPDTLGDCIDLQVECWQDDYKNRKVYHKDMIE